VTAGRRGVRDRRAKGGTRAQGSNVTSVTLSDYP